MRALDQLELKATLAAFKGREALRDRALFVVGVATGFRISELLSLRVEDIRGALSEAPEAQIQIRRRNMKGKKKGRATWLHQEARVALRLYMASRPEARDMEPVFLASGGHQGVAPLARQGKPEAMRPIDRKWAWRMLKRVFRRAGIYDQTVSGTHVMRKTFAQAIFEDSGRNLHVAQKALGHASIQSTVKYLNSVDADVKDLILKRKIA